VLAVSLMAGTVFALLLVAVNTSMVNWSAAWIPLVLILAALLSLTLSSRLLTDRSNVRLVELELARTVSVHSAAGQLPEAGTPLGGVLREYVRTADEMRRHWRTDAYAAGPAMWGAALALLAAIFWGLSFSTGTVWVGYLSIVVELPALTLLFFSVATIATAAGQTRAVSVFAVLTPRRWRTFDDRTPAVDEALAGIPWLAEYARSLQTAADTPSKTSAPWAESTPSPS